MKKDQQIEVNMSKKGKLTSRLERTDRYSEQYQHRLSCRSELGYCLLSEMPKIKKEKNIVMPPQNQNYFILLNDGGGEGGRRWLYRRPSYNH